RASTFFCSPPHCRPTRFPSPARCRSPLQLPPARTSQVPLHMPPFEVSAMHSPSHSAVPSISQVPLQVPSHVALALSSHLPVHSRSEEHTSGLQSRENLVCHLLLEQHH